MQPQNTGKLLVCKLQVVCKIIQSSSLSNQPFWGKTSHPGNVTIRFPLQSKVLCSKIQRKTMHKYRGRNKQLPIPPLTNIMILWITHVRMRKHNCYQQLLLTARHLLKFKIYMVPLREESPVPQGKKCPCFLFEFI